MLMLEATTSRSKGRRLGPLDHRFEQHCGPARVHVRVIRHLIHALADPDSSRKVEDDIDPDNARRTVFVERMSPTSSSTRRSR